MTTRKRLSSDETRRALGAEAPTKVGRLPTDPTAAYGVALEIRERLLSSGGRPTDPAWTVVRKVPMRPETWEKLTTMSAAIERTGIHVAPGQIAAITLERAVEHHRTLFPNMRSSHFHFSQRARDQAHRLHSEICEHGLW